MYNKLFNIDDEQQKKKEVISCIRLAFLPCSTAENTQLR